MKNPKFVVFASLFTLLFSACEKNDADTANPPAEKSPSLRLDFRFVVDGAALVTDTLRYENEAHNQYSVQTLQFYLSRLALVRPDSSRVELKDWLYVDAAMPSTLNLTIQNIPPGCYAGMSFNIGLDSLLNVPGGLPATADNLMMEWPVPMGGGYHFLKLEGYFTDSSGTPGYAMHVGTNACLTSVFLPASLCFQDTEVPKTLFANVNEWFRTPETYNFNTDGNYSMGNTDAMMKLAANGADAFTIH